MDEKQTEDGRSRRSVLKQAAAACVGGTAGLTVISEESEAIQPGIRDIDDDNAPDATYSWDTYECKHPRWRYNMTCFDITAHYDNISPTTIKMQLENREGHVKKTDFFRVSSGANQMKLRAFYFEHAWITLRDVGRR